MEQPQSDITSEIWPTLKSDGFICLKSLAETDAISLIQELGTVIQTTDVIVDPDRRNLVTSAEALDFHTDHHKARYIAWYCHRQTDVGGESKLIDARHSYEQLSKEHRERLQDIRLFEHPLFEDDPACTPLVTVVGGEPHFYYSFWLVKEEDKRDPALLAFRKGLSNNPSFRLKLAAGDLLVIDNHRIFHGRTAIKGNKDRFLKRFWIS
jgi:alpha-ketoglutarate-dependent taurine dioxygenase